MVDLGFSMDLGPMDRIFQELKRRTDDLSKPMAQAGPEALREFDQAFAQDGPGWAPNSGRNPVLDKTGALRASYAQQGAPGNVFVVSPQGAQFGSSLPYAALHQLGGETTLPNGRKVVVPARPVVKTASNDFLSKLGAFTASYLVVRGGY